jgi:hypothetical protein
VHCRERPALLRIAVETLMRSDPSEQERPVGAEADQDDQHRRTMQEQEAKLQRLRSLELFVLDNRCDGFAACPLLTLVYTARAAAWESFHALSYLLQPGFSKEASAAIAHQLGSV